MPNELKLVLDGICEVGEMLKPWATDTFYDFSVVDLNADTVYVIGRKQMLDNRDKVRQAVEQGHRIVYSNPFEGSDTLRRQIIAAGMQDLFQQRKMLLIGGGDMDDTWPCLTYDLFLPKVHNFEENIEQCSRTDEIYNLLAKPRKFLFLNGRGRPHRKWLLEYFIEHNLIDHSIWTWLDPNAKYRRCITYNDKDGQNIISQPRPARFLDPKYEVDRYREHLSQVFQNPFVKYELFDHEWGEIYIKAEPYIDTYFSVVTETVFEYSYSFRTEKIWKPMAIGHPWVCCANRGYYRDLHNLGFRTFGHLIDESFDQIDNDQDRITRLSQVIKDLCEQDLASFLLSCRDVCKYNQQHLLEMRQPVVQQFPNRFLDFLRDHQWMT